MVAKALDRAADVARAGERADPPVHPPSELQPILGFRKLTGPARVAMARCLDGDDQFRHRVRDALADGELDTAGHLYLERPSGWREELATMAARRDDRRRLDEEQRRDRSLERELEQAEARLAELDGLARESAADAKRLHEQLSEARRDRRSRIEDLDAAVARTTTAERAAEEALRRAEEAEAALDVRDRELGAARDQLEAVERELETRPPPDAAARPKVDAADLAEALTRLRGTMSEVEAAVAATDALLPGPSVPLREAPSEEQRSARPRRPTPLPGGVRDDTVEAARHLVKSPGMTLLVDGYNVSMLAWGDAAIDDQRDRLVTRLEALASRAGVQPVAVFDGAHGHPPTPRRPRQQVRVLFSAADVEADDEILALVEARPSGDPVTVVSNDRRVVDGARSRGANVISSTMLLQVL